MLIAPVSVAKSTMCVAPSLRAYQSSVGEDEPALGVGVDDLDRLAVHRAEDVARAGRRRRRACSQWRRRRRARARGSPSSAIAPMPASTAPPPAMSPFMSSM